MEKTFAKVEELANHLKDYVNTKIDSVKLGVAAKSSKLLSDFFARVVVACMCGHADKKTCRKPEENIDFYLVNGL